MEIILIVEDLFEQQQKAKEVVLADGYKAVIADNLEDAFRLWDKIPIAGILTDLHFPENAKGSSQSVSGIAVLTRAVTRKIPVAVCSDINHHYANYLKCVVADLESLSGMRIPFTMDSKDWLRAWNELKNTIKGGN